METGSRIRVTPIRVANPHGAAYSFIVIPGKENTYGFGIRHRVLKKADARLQFRYMANGGTIGIALGSKENR